MVERRHRVRRGEAHDADGNDPHEHVPQGATVFDEIPSLGDRESWAELDRITGIANVVEPESGKRKCSDPVFHGSPNNCKVTVK
jgi:hypothetical protein